VASLRGAVAVGVLSLHDYFSFINESTEKSRAETQQLKNIFWRHRHSIAQAFEGKLRLVAGLTLNDERTEYEKNYSHFTFSFEGDDYDVNFGDMPVLYTAYQALKNVKDNSLIFRDALHAQDYQSYPTTPEINCYVARTFESLAIRYRGFILKSFAKPLAQGAYFSPETARMVLNVCRDDYPDRADLLKYMDDHYQGRMDSADNAASYLVGLRDRSLQVINQAAAQAAQSKAAQVQAENEIEHLRAQLAAAKQENADLSEQLAASQSEAQENKAAVAEVTAQRDDAQMTAAEIDNFRTSNKNLNAQNIRLKANVSELKDTLKVSEGSSKKLTRDMSALNADVDQLEKKVKRLEHTDECLVKAREEITALEKTIAKLEKEKTVIDASFDELKGKLSAVETAKAASDAKIFAQDIEVSVLQGESAGLKSKLEEVQARWEKAIQQVLSYRARVEALESELSIYTTTFSLENTTLSSQRVAKVDRRLAQPIATLMGVEITTRVQMLDYAVIAKAFSARLHEDDTDDLLKTFEFLGNVFASRKDPGYLRAHKEKDVYFRQYLFWDAYIDEVHEFKIRDAQQRY